MSTSSPNATVPRGCNNAIPPEFRYFCDLDSLWGIIVIGVAGFGLILTILFAICFSANIKMYMRHQKNRYSSLLYFVLMGVFSLFAFSLTYVMQPTLIVCILRRVGIGMAWTVTLAPLMIGITRTWKMSYLDEIRCCWLASIVTSLVCVEIIILVEWNILTPPHPNLTTNNRCEKKEYDVALSLTFNAVLLILFFISSIISCWKKNDHITATHHLSSFAISCLITSILTLITSTGWAVMISYGNKALGKDIEWSDPATAAYMVANGIVILITMFSPILRAMMKIRRNNNDDLIDLGMMDRSVTRTSYTIEDIDMARNDGAMAVSDLSYMKPIPAKRSEYNNHIDRLRAPTNGRVNPALQFNEEDIWNNR